MGAVEDRLAELGLEVPEVTKPVASYVPAVRTGSYVYTSGQLPMRAGQLIATGKVGGAVTPEDAAACARQCALNALAAVKAELGDLDAVTRVVKVVCFVASEVSFTGQPQVANGASDLVGGRRSRAADGRPGRGRNRRRGLRCGCPCRRSSSRTPGSSRRDAERRPSRATPRPWW
jgi:enamine deaminase RidA (YjgF/YER057c/UK114 family)